MSKKPDGPSAPATAATDPNDTTGPADAGAQLPQDAPQAGEPGAIDTQVVDPGRSGEQVASAPGADLTGAPQTPTAPEHRLRVRVLEATRVIIECAGKVSLDQELWPGQTRTLSCREPIVLSAGNGGAVVYALDDAAPALLGVVGQQVEGLTVAPIAPPVPEGQDGKDAHAGR